MISDPEAGYLSAPASTREDHPLSASNLRNIGKRRGSTGQNKGVNQHDSDDDIDEDDDKSRSSLSDKSSLFDPQSKLRIRIEEVKAKAIAERNLNDF
jgi:DNA polymerase II large subunit